MKKFILLALAAIATIGFKMSADERVAYDQLPKTAREFITEFFQNDQITVVERDKKPFKTEYEVKFQSGSEADFTGDGTWTEVKAGKDGEIPSGIIPTGISKYVNQNYAGKKIVEIKLDRRGYEIELSNGLDIEFDSNGNFIRIDR